MTARAALLRVASRARGVPERLGLRTIRVWIRSSTRTTAALLTGNTTTNTDTELSPRPAVVELEAADPSYWGAEAAGLTNGYGLAELYQIGPVTPDHASGGYSWSELRPLATTPTNASRVLLADAESGGKLGTSAVEFELVSIKGQDKGRSLRWMLLVRRCRTHATNG